MIKFKHLFSNINAVSEVVGAILLVLMAVVVFSAIYTFFMPPPPDYKSIVKIEAGVDLEGGIVLSHKGGTALTDYRLILKDYPSGNLLSSSIIEDDHWSIGNVRYPLDMLHIPEYKLLDETDMMEVGIYNLNFDGTYEQIFIGVLSGKPEIPPTFSEDLMLITSLKCYSSDEDIICFTHSVNSSLNVTSYIFKWMLNGQGFAHLLMPFDIESDTIAKDYSDEGIDGTVSWATWNESGLIGGCYDYDGAGDSIDTNEVPTMFRDISRGDFTISIWIKSWDISDEYNVVLEICDNYPGFKNYIRIFQFGQEIHMAVLEMNTMHVVRTDNISNNEWYHLAGTWSASKKEAAIYLNGVKSTRIGNRDISFGAHDGMSLGHGSSSTPFWYGQIDELQTFDRVLSDEQIYYLYLTQKYADQNISIIASQETVPGSIWQCLIIPTDGVQEDETWESNLLQIVYYGGGS